MSESANVRSIDAVKQFHAAVLKFQEDARLCLSALELQLLRFIGWLERDRPGFWKREIELCYREMGEARVSYHKCKMRRIGDFRPTCFEEMKALEKAKRDLEFAQKQVPVVKHWNMAAHHEANEYHGRSSQLSQIIEREIPRLLALLRQVVDRLEAYGNVQVPGAAQLPFATTADEMFHTADTDGSAANDDEAVPSSEELPPAPENL